MDTIKTKSIKPTYPRYSRVHEVKSSGSTYTPVGLAHFVATQMLKHFELDKKSAIRILDPAVGDGMLLEALVGNIPARLRSKLDVMAYDTDENALEAASRRLSALYPGVNLSFKNQDFLDFVLSQRSSDLLTINDGRMSFDLIIANPPYVRTQVMGAEQSQRVAKSFDLKGRVDLYYPFLLGIADVLSSTGIAGLITSNRFMTTKSGQSVRREILSKFDVLHVWDFGDTKLFDAAVLPSVLLARGMNERSASQLRNAGFSSVYETEGAAQTVVADVFAGLEVENDSVVELPDRRKFRVRHGLIDNGNDPEGTWRLATTGTDEWLATVEANTWKTFGQVGKIRVGVKSTADKVFVRSDWSELPGGRPELLRPLITRRCARQYKACLPDKEKDRKEILYPHETDERGRRAPVDLGLYPIAASYLEAHRRALESRTYVIEAGRKWYELWVPHDPAAWKKPKLVFLDISVKPTFWIDLDGGVVNGECYWLQCEKEGEDDLLWLAAAIANSTFIESFYDHRFNNKLYAGRRRFITQYVEKFPLPNPARKEVKAIIQMAKNVYELIPSESSEKLLRELDEQVWRAFGLDFEKVSR